MHRRTQTLTLTVAAALATVVLHAPGAHAGPAQPLYVEHDSYEALEALVEERPDDFAGVQLHASGTATVYVSSTQGKARLDTWARQHRPPVSSAMPADEATTPWRVVLAPAARSLSELTSVRNAVHAADGVARVHVEDYLDPASGTVALTVLERTAAVRDLEKDLGDRLSVTVDPSPRPHRVSRTDDGPPYKAGGRVWIVDPVIGERLRQCTTGFAVNYSSQQMLTAGHCGTLYDEVETGPGRYVGWINARSLTQNGYDAARIAGTTYSPSSFVGPATSSTHHGVHSAQPSPLNQKVCSSGSFTGERCTSTIDTGPLCITFPDGIRTCHLIKTSSPSGAVVQGGDSGGPVYRYRTSTTLYAMGIIVGGDDTGHRMYYHRIGDLLAMWGLTLRTQ